MFVVVIDGFLSKCAEQKEFSRGIPSGREIREKRNAEVDCL